jgi:hypothetical protein
MPTAQSPTKKFECNPMTLPRDCGAKILQYKGLCVGVKLLVTTAWC